MSRFLTIFYRLAYLAVQVIAITFITFVMVRMIPGDPARLSLGPLVSDEAVEAVRDEMRLNEPIISQYLYWAQNALKGDLGQSWVNNSSVTDEMIARIPVTLELIMLAMTVVVLVLVPLAILSAQEGKGLLQRIFRRIAFGYGMLAGALPDFVLGLLLILLFYTHLDWLPGPEGRLSFLDTEPPVVTGFILIDTLLAGDFKAFRSAITHLVMPVFVLAFVYGAPVFKMMRSQMETSLSAEYTTYGRVVGLKPLKVSLRAARAAAAPTIVIAGVIVTFLLGGAVLVESVFNFAGLGQFAVQSIVSADYASIQAFVSFAAVMTVRVYALVDFLHWALDPRVRN